MGKAEPTVRRYLHEGREQLRRSLQEEENEG